MNRIAIIGSSGSGKSYLATELGKHYKLPVINLDDVILDENYEKPSPEIYRKRVATEANKEQWVIEGVYPKIGDIVWPAAEVVIWLNLPFDDVRERYDEREERRERRGPFPDINIHKKEYLRLTKLYPELLGKLVIKRLIEITRPDYTIEDIVSDL